ncbi:MAG: TRAP transporter small permease [Proteobacteria bacterium]|nr:TRAP transporter small permease [Pseudomonadota bacterium]
MEFFTRAIDFIDRIFQFFLIFFMVEITLVISIAVVSRYFMNAPIYWAEEVIRYSFVWATFLGAACAFRQGELVAMSVVLNALSDRNQKLARLLLEIIIGFFLVVTLVFGIQMAQVVAPQLTVSTRVSMAWLYGVVPVSCTFMLLCCIDNICGHVRSIMPVNKRRVP